MSSSNKECLIWMTQKHPFITTVAKNSICSFVCSNVDAFFHKSIQSSHHFYSIFLDPDNQWFLDPGTQHYTTIQSKPIVVHSTACFLSTPGPLKPVPGQGRIWGPICSLTSRAAHLTLLDTNHALRAIYCRYYILHIYLKLNIFTKSR